MTAPDASGDRILVVEERLQEALALETFFVERGCSVVLAGDLNSALDLLHKQQFTLVVTGKTAAAPDVPRASAEANNSDAPLMVLTTVSAWLDNLQRASSGLGRASASHIAALKRLIDDTPPSSDDELAHAQQALDARDAEMRLQTERLRASEQNYRALLESTIDGQVVVDGAGLVRYMNPAAERLFASDSIEVVGRPFQFQIGQDRFREIVIHIPGRGATVAEMRVFQTVWESAPASLVALRDISDRKRAEEQIRDQQHRLEQANMQLHALATIDALTGLKNYRVFQERLHEEFHRASRYDLPLSLIVLDVDRFKEFNDSFGHATGDAALQRVSEILKMSTRETDIAARYGGEEFVILLPNTLLDGAHILAERIRKAIEGCEWPHRTVTASLGVAAISSRVRSATELFSAADAALYCSKQQGRNRTTVATSITLPAANAFLHV